MGDDRDSHHAWSRCGIFNLQAQVNGLIFHTSVWRVYFQDPDFLVYADNTMNKISRRLFLKLSLGAGLLASSGYIFKTVLWPSQVTPDETKTLSAYLDTLIPPDVTPGAVQLNVPEMIISKSRTDRKYRRLIKKGCRWLDTQAGDFKTDTFASLGGETRQEIVKIASEAERSSLPGIFFKQIRLDAFFYYYGTAESWEGLGYDGPPQPLGFPDYTYPPGEIT